MRPYDVMHSRRAREYHPSQIICLLPMASGNVSARHAGWSQK